MKILTNLCLVVVVFTSVNAQEIPVSRQPQKRNVVLEEYTGINCPWCPEGHRIANKIEHDNPGRAVLINVHTGSYATPVGSQPDLRTNFGTSLVSQTGLDAYPAATVNRHLFAGNTSLSIEDRDDWTPAANEILLLNGIANLGVEAEIDIQTRVLTVTVEVYNTGSTSNPQGKNRLTVMLLQNNIIGPQTIHSQATPDPNLVLPDGNYIHNHVLRHVIVPDGAPGQNYPFGEEISGIIGAVVSKTYTYALPDSIRDVRVVLNDLTVAAIVSETTKEIITGHVVKPVFTNFKGAHDSGVINAWTEESAVCGFTASPHVRILNLGSGMLTSLLVDYTVNGSPVKTYKWTGSLSPAEETEIVLNGINFFPSSTNTLTVVARLPNGSADADDADNEKTYVFGSAPDVSGTLYMSLKMDEYGEEITWEVINSAGAVLYQGGPYPNIQSAPEVLDTFTVTTGDCYEFKVYDEYGDGLLGAGIGFTLRDDQGFTLISAYKDYGSEGTIPFGVDAPQPDSSDVFSGVSSLSALIGITVYPNPASGTINLVFTAPLHDFALNLSNSLGQTVLSFGGMRSTGDNIIRLDAASLSPGIYFLNVLADGRIYSEKIAVSH